MMPTHRLSVVVAWLWAAALAGACHRDAMLDPSTTEHQPDAPAGADVYRLTAASAARHGIATEAAALRVLRRHLTAPARLAFDAEKVAHIGTPLRGRVAELGAALGAAVAAGDTVLVIDSPELGEAQIEFLQRRSTAATTAPRVEFAKEAWTRAEALFAESQGIAASEVRRREADYGLAVAAQKEAEAAAMAAENRLRLFGMTDTTIATLVASGTIRPRLAITAPFAGTITARDITRGELVAPDRESLLTIVDRSVLWVLAQVPESRLGDVEVGAPAEIRISGATVPARTGKVTFIAPMLDEATRSAEVRIEVTADDESLRPGMFAEARISLPAAAATVAGSLSIHEAAVQSVGGQTVVFVPCADEPHAYRLRPVEVGRAVDGFLPVHAGLSLGEQVVTTGSFVLKAQATQGGDAAEDK